MKSTLFFLFVVLLSASCVTSKQNQDSVKDKEVNEQWDFCQCVVMLDSIDSALENPKLTPVQVDKLMERWDYLDKMCKEVTTFDNETPEDRSKHEKRVMKCLEEVKK